MPHGTVRVSVPDLDGEDFWVDTEFILDGNRIFPVVTVLDRPMPDGTTQRVNVSITVTVVPTPKENT